MRLAFLTVLLVPLFSVAQEGLTTVRNLVVGDPHRPTDQLVEFGFNAVVSISDMDSGCTITINPSAPIETSFGCLSEGVSVFSIKGQSNDGEYSSLSSTMSADLPITLWTRVYSAQCECPAGKYVSISEMKRP